MAEFRMPSLGADMEAGRLVEWLVKPGDRVKRGDIVAVVETQKGAIEIEIFESGRLERILVDLGAKVPVGTPLAEIETDAERREGRALWRLCHLQLCLQGLSRCHRARRRWRQHARSSRRQTPSVLGCRRRREG
jgi:pyruvate/2-oxoglutarate dehydrogenase complex dihydrolipoamide acyltransferase (E2) component